MISYIAVARPDIAAATRLEEVPSRRPNASSNKLVGGTTACSGMSTIADASAFADLTAGTPSRGKAAALEASIGREKAW